MISSIKRAAACLVLALAGVFAAKAAPPLEVYGKLPEIREIAISDSGDMIATLREDENGEYVLVTNYATGDRTGFKVENFKPLSVEFFGDRYVLLRASATESHFNAMRRFEYGFGFIFDIETDEVYQLLEKQDNLFPSADASNVVGVLEESGELLIPTWTYSQNNSAQNNVSAGISGVGSTVFRVLPKNGRTRVFEGDRDTSARMSTGSSAKPKYEFARDWVISTDGTILAREDYKNYDNDYRIYTRKGGSWELIYENDPLKTSFIGGKPLNVVGSTLEEDALFVRGFAGENLVKSLYKLGFDGQISAPLFDLTDKDVARVLSDDNRRVFAVEFSGLAPSYAFFDKALGEKFSALQKKMDGFSLTIVDWTKARDKLVVKIDGGAETGSYYLFDVASGKLSLIAKRYDIPGDQVGEMQTIEYRGAGGLTISAVVTWPPGTGDSGFPAVILPHGGPAAYDSLKFDWLAQSFASRGYLVFQPNFRGSEGFGEAFERAGDGEWGGLIQDDIAKGVAALKSLGWVDPDRICIVGASFGGYAALEAATQSPDAYQCVAAIAPVTDLPDWFREIRVTGSEWDYDFEYWSQLIGDPNTDMDKLVADSPARNAEAVKAPVLLVHGKDDTVVLSAQSHAMKNALQSAGKDVELVELKGGDHWLTTSDARMATLSAVSVFVDKHIGGPDTQ